MTDLRPSLEQLIASDQFVGRHIGPSDDDIAKMLKPKGGGGTHVGCVSDYIIKSSINAEALVIFTDGYVENNPKWEVTTPTMWFVTQNSSFVPPAGGRCVTVEQ